MVAAILSSKLNNAESPKFIQLEDNSSINESIISKIDASLGNVIKNQDKTNQIGNEIEDYKQGLSNIIEYNNQINKELENKIKELDDISKNIGDTTSQYEIVKNELNQLKNNEIPDIVKASQPNQTNKANYFFDTNFIILVAMNIFIIGLIVAINKRNKAF